MNIIQYRNLIVNFFENHSLINTVKTGNKFNFNADSKIIYPVAHIEFITRKGADNNAAFSFLVSIADKYDRNLQESEEYIISDCSDICSDAVNEFSNDDTGRFILEENVTIEPFTQGHTDRICGCSVMLIFNEDDLKNVCSIPKK